MGFLLFILFLVLGIVVSPWFFFGCGALLLLSAWADSPSPTPRYTRRRKPTRRGPPRR